MQDNLFVFVLAECHRLVDFLALLDEDRVDFQLDRLPLNDLLLYSILGDQAVDVDIFHLTDSMTSIHCLQVYHGIEIGVVEHDMIGCDQVDTESTCSRRDQEDCFIGVRGREFLNLSLSISQLRRTIKSAIRYAAHRQIILDDRQQSCEAREENDLLVLGPDFGQKFV